jgi:hypothetical protein
MDKKKTQEHVARTLLMLLMLGGMAIITAMIRMTNAQPTLPTPMDFRQDSLQAALQEAEAIRAFTARLDTLRGTVTDTAGVALQGVVVSDGYSCVATDSAGQFCFRKHADAKFIYYSVPDYCAVPVHGENDSTACFYREITDTDTIYNFALTRLPGGKERRYRMIVIGDPQVTNAFSPYYEGPDDNPVEKSDVARFTDETMADIRQTLAELPADMPVYGLSMGDDVQYYGGYNDSLELAIRRALGASRMIVFSVIGNHDQDGKKVYKDKWEETWGPTDYSFDRGDVHYVCFNNCDFYHGGLYYSPGELSDDQMHWLEQDLALADTTKKVILCYHIPFTFGNRPAKGAQELGIASEKGHYTSSRLSRLLAMLDRFEGGYELFCGHTHFALNHEIDYEGRHVTERCHAAACGNIWQSNVNICGTPNGYYVYSFDRTELKDSYYKGTRWRRDQQMTLFRADTDFNDENYATDWKLPEDRGVLVANVWNADSRWHVTVMENGREQEMTRISSTGQDAFATGYHHKYAKSVSYWFVSKNNGYLIMNHLYYYVPRSPRSTLFVTAIDPYGNTYRASTSEVVKQPFHNYAHYYQ